MRKNILTLKEIQSIDLDMLYKLDFFCKDKRIKYYLAGGTLLGAIRHKGFIPWDDDIDVCMPRKDYIKFINSSGDFSKEFNDIDIIHNVGNKPFIKLAKKNTYIDNFYATNDVDVNLCIDIFPVDGLSENIEEVKEVYKKCDFYRKLLILCDAKLGVGTTALKKYSKYLLKPLAKLYGKQRCINKIEKIAAKYPYEESEYVGIVTWGLYGAGERMLKSEFEKSIEVEFEGHKFPAFSCWDSYLRGLYGDYMQLPPIEKRKSHDMVAYLIEEEEL